MRTLRFPVRPTRAGRALRPATAVAALLAAGACYAYTPTRPAMVAPGQDVRVTVDDGLAQRHADALGSSERTWEGRIEARDGADLLIAVPTGVREGRGGSQVLSQRIRVRPEDLLSVDVRAFDAWRTAVVVGVAAVAVVAVVVRGWVDLGGSSDDGPSPGPGQLAPPGG